MERGHRLINFETYRALSDKISEVLQYQGKQRDLDSVPIIFEPLTYLEEKLANTSLSKKAEAELEGRGEELRIIEEGKHDRRTDDWIRAGFLAN